MPIRPLLLGHRGARIEKSFPENSLASFDRALACGCDGFELDVRFSADGQPVIYHDARVQGFEVARRSAAELALPLLRDVLARYRTTAFLDIELKVAGWEATTLDLLRACTPLRGYVISSFLPDVLRTIRAAYATIPLGLICEDRDQLDRWSTLPIEYVIPHHKLITRDSINQIKISGKKVFVWTVNTAKDMKRFAEWEVDGIISDDPRRLAAVVGGRSRTSP
jgi:glycerophosphoryl diester phosphodiesterase